MALLLPLIVQNMPFLNLPLHTIFGSGDELSAHRITFILKIVEDELMPNKKWEHILISVLGNFQVKGVADC